MNWMKHLWWRILCIIIMIYVVSWGLLGDVPSIAILHETIRNLYFHVPMWFGMIIIFSFSVVYSIRYLSSSDPKMDIAAEEAATIGMLFGCFGLVTGMIWAFFTWGDWWSNDPKQNAAAIGMLIYAAYFVLRGSLDDMEQRGRVAAVYNIFAFAALIPLLFILPRLTDSLHPGAGGNPGFNAYDLDSRMRMVFYPAVIGWTLIGVWIFTIRYRSSIIRFNDRMKKIK